VLKAKNYTAFEALKPYFELVEEGLSGLVDGDHYFDTIADDAYFEFLYDFPGWRSSDSQPQRKA